MKMQDMKIAEIVAVIEGVAFQTSMLALDAAVEAARAGAQSRRFARVANDLRSLARRNAEVAEEIRGLIGADVLRVERCSKAIARAGGDVRQSF